jgi:hypothetical protein
MTAYNLVMRKADGSMLAQISDFVSLSYGYAEGTVGALSLVVDENNLDFDMLNVDNIIEVWRQPNGLSSYLEGERCFYVRKWEIVQQQFTDKLLAVINAEDGNTLVKRRIVAAQEATAQADKTDNADDMMKAYVREQAGALATVAARNMAPYLTVQADFGLATSQTLSSANTNLMDVLNNISNLAADNSSEYLVFDTIYLGSGQNLFCTYLGARGNNHGQTSGDIRLFSPSLNNLTNASLVNDYTECKNYCYAGGSGSGSAREIATASDNDSVTLSVLNRCEFFYNASGLTGTTEITNAGKAELGRLKVYETFTAEAVDTASMRYAVDYGYGDIVTVQFAGKVLDAHVYSVQGNVQNGEESLTIGLRGAV